MTVTHHWLWVTQSSVAGAVTLRALQGKRFKGFFITGDGEDARTGFTGTFQVPFFLFVCLGVVCLCAFWLACLLLLCFCLLCFACFLFSRARVYLLAHAQARSLTHMRLCTHTCVRARTHTHTHTLRRARECSALNEFPPTGHVLVFKHDCRLL